MLSIIGQLTRRRGPDMSQNSDRSRARTIWGEERRGLELWQPRQWRNRCGRSRGDGRATVLRSTLDLPVSPKITTRADAGRRVIALRADASPSNPANEVITDFDAGKPAGEVITTSGLLSGAAEIPATSDGPAHLQPQAESGPCPMRRPSASACEPYRELIEVGLGRGEAERRSWWVHRPERLPRRGDYNASAFLELGQKFLISG